MKGKKTKKEITINEMPVVHIKPKQKDEKKTESVSNQLNQIFKKYA